MCSSHYDSRFPAALHAVITAALLALVAVSCIRLIASAQFLGAPPIAGAPATLGDPEVSILVYHRFGPSVRDAMTIRTATFRWQLDYLEQHGYTIVPLRALVSYLSGRAAAPPRRSVVITADDGHVSVFTEMLPVVREHQVPVTLFVYPSAISNAAYAMTWEQLDMLRRTGLFDIGSHTYWHPNFKTEKGRLSPAAYRAFATMQLVKSRDVLKDKLRVEADVIAWPFGIYDDELIAVARDAGYMAGVTLERRVVTRREPIMALPRFLVTDGASGARFRAMLRDNER
jgi:peptidoglycan/xylan/chitin deacetylase (PgdA/CDA1 family)